MLKKIKKCLVLLLAISLLIGCSAKNSGGNVGTETAVSSIAETGTAISGKQEQVETAGSSYAAEDKEYALALPIAEEFRNIFEDFIYWEYQTMIEREEHYSIYSRLKEENCLDKDLKIHLYYRECDVEEMDYGEHNHYNVFVLFPDNEKLSYYSMTYNARGLSSDYNYGYPDWFDTERDFEEASSQELESDEEFQKQYNFFGETTLRVENEKANHYVVEDKFSDGEKDKILTEIKKSIQKQYKESDNIALFVRDFLPADEELQGEEIILSVTNKNEIPLFWIQSTIHYSGAKMKKFDGITWHTRYSTYFQGIDNWSLDDVKQWAKRDYDAIDVNKCVLAYEIRDGKMVDLK